MTEPASQGASGASRSASACIQCKDQVRQPQQSSIDMQVLDTVLTWTCHRTGGSSIACRSRHLDVWRPEWGVQAADGAAVRGTSRGCSSLASLCAPMV